MAKLKYEAVATTGEYTNKQGEKKKRYTRVGNVFEDDQGRLSLKLDVIPVGPGWSGYISFYEPKRDDRPAQSSPRPQQQAAPARQNDYSDDDDIPF